MIRALPVLALLLAALPGPGRANDSIAELSTGGLVLRDSAEIEMARERLLLSPETVEVDYVFRNRTDRDVAATVAFPMPDVEGPDEGMAAIPAETDNFLDFTVMQDGKPVHPTLEARAFLNGTDVTDELTRAGVPVMAVVQPRPPALAALSAPLAKAWEQRGLVRADRYDAGKGWQTDLVPQWTARSAWHWRTVFPAGAEIHVAHRYRPSLGGSVAPNFIDYETQRVGGPMLGEYRDRYCMDAAFEKGVNRMLARQTEGTAVIERRLSYVLGTGGNWAGGRIGDFTLIVDKGRPDALVSFCGTGIEKIAPTQFRMTARDYAPPPMLEVLIVTPAP